MPDQDTIALLLQLRDAASTLVDNADAAVVNQQEVYYVRSEDYDRLCCALEALEDRS